MTEKEENISKVARRTYELWRSYFNNDGTLSQGKVLQMISNEIRMLLPLGEPEKEDKTSEDNCNIDGVSLRDFFAAEAMKGLLTSLTNDEAWKTFARMAELKTSEPAKDAVARMGYSIADAMLAKKHKS